MVSLPHGLATQTSAPNLLGFGCGDRRHDSRRSCPLPPDTVILGVVGPGSPFILIGEMTARRFPPTWSVEDIGAAFVVKDGGGQKLAYVY